jgi:hypothetical protein
VNPELCLLSGLDGKSWTLLGKLLSLLLWLLLLSVQVFSMSHTTLAAIQPLLLCSVPCSGGSLSCLGGEGGGVACCWRLGGNPGGDGGFELDDWFPLVICEDAVFVDVFVQAWGMVQVGAEV